MSANPLFFMVGTWGFEPQTSTVSRHFWGSLNLLDFTNFLENRAFPTKSFTGFYQVLPVSLAHF